MTNKDLAVYIISEQYKLAGLTLEQINGMSEDEFSNVTITKEQSEQWYIWAIEYLRKKKRWSKLKCRKEVGMIDLFAGLKVNYDRANIEEHSQGNCKRCSNILAN